MFGLVMHLHSHCNCDCDCSITVDLVCLEFKWVWTFEPFPRHTLLDGARTDWKRVQWKTKQNNVRWIVDKSDKTVNRECNQLNNTVNCYRKSLPVSWAFNEESQSLGSFAKCPIYYRSESNMNCRLLMLKEALCPCHYFCTVFQVCTENLSLNKSSHARAAHTLSSGTHAFAFERNNHVLI